MKGFNGGKDVGLNPLFVEAGITIEMIDWYYKRTNYHMELVKKYCRKIVVAFPEFEELTDISPYHDSLKFEEPEQLPYIRLTWLHKTDGYKGYKKPGTLLDRQMNDATLHHVQNSKHHPEYWDGRKIEFNSSDNRNAVAPGIIVNGTKMPNIYVAEMVADWMAMSEELSNPTCVGWANRNINIRWSFTPEQVALIWRIIEAIPVETVIKMTDVIGDIA